MKDDSKCEASKVLVKLERTHRNLLEKSFMNLGIFSSQHRVLMYLSDRGENLPSQKEIAETFDVSPAAVAVSLRKLEEAGYIQKKAFDKDNRVNNVSLTDKGKAVAEKTMVEVKNISESIFSNMTDEETEQFTALMTKVLTSVNNLK